MSCEQQLAEVQKTLLQIKETQAAMFALLRTLVATLPNRPPHLETRRQP
jgi:hypothetical protein